MEAPQYEKPGVRRVAAISIEKDERGTESFYVWVGERFEVVDGDLYMHGERLVEICPSMDAAKMAAAEALKVPH